MAIWKCHRYEPFGWGSSFYTICMEHSRIQWTLGEEITSLYAIKRNRIMCPTMVVLLTPNNRTTKPVGFQWPCRWMGLALKSGKTWPSMPIKMELKLQWSWTISSILRQALVVVRFRAAAVKLPAIFGYRGSRFGQRVTSWKTACSADIIQAEVVGPTFGARSH